DQREEVRKLRAENEQLRTIIASLESKITSLEDVIKSLQGSNTTLGSAMDAQRKALEDQKVAFEKVLGELQSLQRRFLGPKSERMPTPRDELRAKRGIEPDPMTRLEKRKRNAEAKSQVRTETIMHRVPDEKRCCPKCGGTA